jgi:hypothetical protein
MKLLFVSVRSRLVAAAGLVVLAAPAHAIPAFARKYRTSCQTCHTAYPKLNPFGQAFRLRGYRMPEETEDMVKEVPVPLGAPSYKKLWPDAVWPGDIPGTVPFSLSTDFAVNTSRSTNEDGESETVKGDFSFPEEVALLSGGTLGETMSFFGEVIFVQEVADGSLETGAEVEHAQFHVNGPWGTGPALNLKIGRFMPELSQAFGHGPLLVTGDAPAVFHMYNPIGVGGGSGLGEEGGGIAVPHGVDGLEVYGVVHHRFLYSAGLANGIGPGANSFDGNNSKDLFGRVACKIGGLALDGNGYVPSDKNWRERSIQIGAFAYRGNGRGIFLPADSEEQVLEDRTFYRVGADVNLYLQDLNLIAGYVHGRDTLATYDVTDEGRAFTEQGDSTYKAWFAEGDYVIKPWLHGALRYEWLRPAHQGAPDVKRITPNLTALIRANVKAYVEYQRSLGASGNYTLVADLRFAF